MTAFLEIKNLCKEYEGHRALRRVSFNLEAGDFLSLFGPNGAGKSTLLGVISTLLTATSGSIAVRGFDLAEEPEKFKMQLGIISHHSLLYDHMSCRENLLFYGALYGLDDPQLRADELLRIVDLYPRRHSKVGHFSRGMRQRLSIARALINDPSLLLLDEPFSGLDQYASGILSEQLLELKSRKRTVIMVTHNLDHGLAAASKVGILAAGKLACLTDRESIDLPGFEKQYLDSVEGGRGL